MEIVNKLIYHNTNRYREFLSAAKIISKKIARIRGVVGIIATGGIGRGYCDGYSDLDLIVYADDNRTKDIRNYIAVGWLAYKGIELDTPVESYQKALNHKSPSRYWSQVIRWDRENSKVLFDPNDKIKKLLEKKLVFPDWEQKRLLRKYCWEIELHLKHYFEMWEKRGEIVNLAQTLIRAAENIVLWIYAKNRKFQPYIPKWLFYHLENKAVSESQFFDIIKKPFLEPIETIRRARQIQKELLGFCEKIGLQYRFKDVKEILNKEGDNWKKATEKTKYYLSW